MKTASVAELKQELQNIPPKELMAHCLRLAKFKKENKELLNYLLFESHDVEGYTNNVKEMMSEAFREINTSNLFFVKKSLRKILRIANKHIKYTADKQAEVTLRIYFCSLIKASGINIKKSNVLQNMYANQLKKIKLAIEMLHEDIQYDFLKEVASLE